MYTMENINIIFYTLVTLFFLYYSMFSLIQLFKKKQLLNKNQYGKLLLKIDDNQKWSLIAAILCLIALCVQIWTSMNPSVPTVNRNLLTSDYIQMMFFVFLIIFNLYIALVKVEIYEKGIFFKNGSCEWNDITSYKINQTIAEFKFNPQKNLFTKVNKASFFIKNIEQRNELENLAKKYVNKN